MYWIPFVIAPALYFTRSNTIMFLLLVNSLIHYSMNKIIKQIIIIPGAVRYEIKYGKSVEDIYKNQEEDLLEIDDKDIRFIPRTVNVIFRLTYILTISFLIAGLVLLVRQFT